MKGLWLLVKGAFLLARARLAKKALDLYNPKMPEILKWPDPRLKEKAIPLLEGHDYSNDRDIIDLCKQMHMVLTSTKYGQKLGLAANQIGRSENIAIVLGRVCINPTFNPPGEQTPKDRKIEGCYSCDGTYLVERWPYVWCSWYDITGKKHTEKSNGVFGHVFMHEVNHLEGVCIADIGIKQTEPKTT